LATVLLLAASQFFYLALSFSALQKMQTESSRQVESLLLDGLGNRLGLIARTGRDLDRYPVLEEELRRFLNVSKADFFFLVKADGQVMGGRAPARNFSAAELNFSADGTVRFEAEGRTWLGRLISDWEGRPSAYLLAAPSSDGTETVWSLFRGKIGFFGLTTLLSVLILALALIWGEGRIRSRALSRTKVYALFLVPFFFGQALFFGTVVRDISSVYREHNRQLAGQLTENLALDLEKLLGKNVALSDIPSLEEHLRLIGDSFPLVGSVAVLDDRDRPVSAAGREPLTLDGQEQRFAPIIEARRPLTDLSGGSGTVRISLSPAALRAGFLPLFLDNATMALVSALLMMELARAIVVKLQSPPKKKSEKTSAPASGPHIMRPVVFVALFALDLSLSFIPLKMASLDSNLPFLSKEMILSLPISAEMALAGAASIGGGFLAIRFGGWKTLFVGGVLLASLGYGLSAFSASAMVYILARSLAGLGYGSLNIASQIFVIGRVKPGQQGEALGDLFAGFFSGGLCGCAAGGLLADRLGFAPVFSASAAILLGLACLVLLFMPDDRAEASSGAAGVSLEKMLRFVGSRPIWSLGLFNVIPAAVVMVGLINYFLPIHVSSMGGGPAIISQLNVLFSLLVVFLGPRFGRLLDGSRRQWLFLLAAGFLAGLAFFPFQIWPTLLGAVLGMIFLGLSNAISENGQGAYLLNRPETKLIGDNQALSIYTAAIRIGQVAGPMAVAMAVGSFGLKGLWVLGVGMLVLNLLFGLLAPKTRTAQGDNAGLGI
jgi:predicted MFS family arabinose efflux permease